MSEDNEDKLEPSQLAVFKDKIRRQFHNEEWWFSVVDVVGALTESPEPRKYWFDIKRRVADEEKTELSEFCRQLKLLAPDGKMRPTDCANIEGLFRIIQSIPSPKVERFKRWLAKVGYERVQEIEDPEKSIDRARDNWKKHGRSDKWVQQRMMGQETRNKLTGYWKDHHVNEGVEFATLTNIIHQEWTGLSVKDHKTIKGLKNQNLRDHMNEAELILTALAELSTRQIAETTNANGFDENKVAAQHGGQIAGDARKKLEEQTGQSVISKTSYLPNKE